MFKNKMNILIDATNILPDSGGFIHLRELLKNYEYKEPQTIYVATSNKVIEKIGIKKKKVKFISNFFLNKSKFLRLIWQIFFINKCLKKNKCSKLFVLGGYFFFVKNFKVILLIQNILPFEKKIFLQEKFSLIIKNYVLYFLHKFSILRSDGVILLSKYSRKVLGKKKISYKVIPHGIQKKILQKTSKKRTNQSNI